MNFITPVEITPSTTSSWEDVDVSSYVPSGATGVVLHIVNTSSSTYHGVGYRKNGSTDTYYDGTYTKYGGHFWATIGVDSSRILEIYTESSTAIDIYLVGYFTTDAVFFTNHVDKSLSSSSSWIDIDISSDTGSDTAIGAMFKIDGQGSSVGMRKNGSSDARTNSAYYQLMSIIGVDGSEICEGYIANTSCDFYMVGYIKSDSTFNTNATDISLTSTGAWTDLSALPSGAIGGFLEVVTTSTSYGTVGLRKNGSSENIVKYVVEKHDWAIVECDASQIIEGYIESTTTDIFVIGYATAVSTGQTATVIDTLALAGSITALRGLASTTSDTLSLTESITALRARLSSISDAIGLTEAVTSLKGLSVSVSETLHLGEAATAIKAVFIEISDSIGLAEAATSLRNRISNVTDSISLSEVLSAIRARFASVSDSLHLSELASAAKAIFISISDSLDLTDTITAVRSRIASLTDSLSLSETATSFRARIASISDSLHISEIMTSLRGRISSIVDTISLAGIVTTGAIGSIVKSKQYIIRSLNRAKNYILKIKP